MNTLLIPCAGKSSRFPNMKPKWMLTHPDGSLMIEKAVSGLDLSLFDRIIITIVKPHDEKYEAGLILSQVFASNPKIEICILDDFTSSASETIALTIDQMHITDSLIIKDSDNMVQISLPPQITNQIIGYDLRTHRDVTNVPEKSFLILNQQGIIQDIIEKQVVSNIICLGIYCFEDVKDFQWGYQQLCHNNVQGEMFVSHVISYLISQKKCIFTAQMADAYEDWGTLKEWQAVQKRFRTYFIDVDGVIMKNSGQYGSTNWRNNQETLPTNIEEIKKLQNAGAQIVITTSRTEEYRKDLEKILHNIGIKPYCILMGLNHSARVIINDFAPTNPYPSGIAISLPRNASIKEYL